MRHSFFNQNSFLFLILNLSKIIKIILKYGLSCKEGGGGMAFCDTKAFGAGEGGKWVKKFQNLQNVIFEWSLR